MEMAKETLASLKDELIKKGGTSEDWNMALHHGLEAGDLEWVDTVKGPLNAESYAEDFMASGSYLEYDCYDDRGRDQGRAVLKILGWDAGMPYTLNAEHVVASDGYYEWYAQHNLKSDKVVYHVCPTRRKKCSEKLPKGDGRIFIHLMRWRMVNPLILKELDYSRVASLQILKDWVNSFVKATPVTAPGSRAPGGPTGLTGRDEAQKEAAPATVPQSPTVEKVEKGLRGSRAVGAFLHERAEKRRKEEGQTKGDETKRYKRSLGKDSPSRGRSKEKKKKKKKREGAHEQREEQIEEGRWTSEGKGLRDAKSCSDLEAKAGPCRAESELQPQDDRDPEGRQRSRSRGRREKKRRKERRRTSKSKIRGFSPYRKEKIRVSYPPGKRSEGEERIRERLEVGQEPKARSEEESDLESGVTSVHEDAAEVMEAFRGWLRSEECGGLSIAQAGAHLLLAIRRSPTSLATYLERSLVMPGSDIGSRGKRQRSLLPLPFKADSRTAMKQILDRGEFKRLAGTWSEKRQVKAGKEMRRLGLLVWHGLLTLALNHLWTGGGGPS